MIGFFTTFTMLARDHLTLKEVSWILIKVFFGSSYIGFDVMNDISPAFGPPLMLIFVCLTNILLITSLISILSNSFAKVTAHAREEYLYIYSIYVLEASSSSHLTHFYPPFNLLPLFFIRPLRLFVSNKNIRRIRIIVLKATHSPMMAAIWVYEYLHDRIYGAHHMFMTVPPRGNTYSKKAQRPAIIGWTTAMSVSHDLPKTPRPDSSEMRPEPGKSGVNMVKGWMESAVKGGKQEQEELEKKVDDLSTKIEELTALIMASTQKNGLQI